MRMSMGWSLKWLICWLLRWLIKSQWEQALRCAPATGVWFGSWHVRGMSRRVSLHMFWDCPCRVDPRAPPSWLVRSLCPFVGHPGPGHLCHIIQVLLTPSSRSSKVESYHGWSPFLQLVSQLWCQEPRYATKVWFSPSAWKTWWT